MKTSKEIYNELITRCKQHVKDQTVRAYSPSTGIQQIYVAGKLTETIQVHETRSTLPKDPR